MRRLVSAYMQWQILFLLFAICAGLPAQLVHAENPTVALLLQQTPVQGGVVTPSIGVYQFEPNSEITISAVPQRGYQFVYWLGEVADPSSSVTIAYLDKPKIIIAVFEKVDFDHSAVGDNRASSMYSTSGGGGSSSGLRYSSSISSGGGRSVSTSSGGQSTEGDSPGDIPDIPIVDPPDEPPVPEPATVILLGLGSLALLKKRITE